MLECDDHKESSECTIVETTGAPAFDMVCRLLHFGLFNKIIEKLILVIYL